jgi:hypothetical protein
MDADPSAESEHAATVPATVAGELGQDAPVAGPREPGPQEPGPHELAELGGRLLQGGDPAGAAQAFADALARLSADDPACGQLLAGLGISLLEQALAAFAAAAQSADARIRPLAVELLARGLPLRDRDDEAAQAWQRGMADPDPEVAAAVRARLRRAFGVDAEAGAQFWWDGFMESAVCHGTLPVLANELFGALDHMYALVAVPYARKARQRELWEALAQAVRVPSAYAWGPGLHESFRARLRDAMGAESDVLPPDWPEAG